MIKEGDSSQESTPKLPRKSKVGINKTKIGSHLVLNQIEMNDQIPINQQQEPEIPSYVSSIILAEL